MPVRPLPKTYVCSKCGWKKTVQPRSDALGPGDVFLECPRCGNDKLDVQIDRPDSNSWSNLFNHLKH